MNNKAYNIFLYYLKPLLLLLYIGVAWIYFLFENEIYLFVSVLLGLPLLFYVKKIRIDVLVMLALIFVGVLMNLSVNGRYLNSYTSYVVFIFLYPATIIVGIILIQEGWKYYGYIVVIILCVLIYMLYELYINGAIYAEVFFEKGSRNHFSTLLLSAAIIFSSLMYDKYRKIDIIVPVIIFFVNIYLVGRTAFVTSFLYMITSVLFKFLYDNSIKKIIILGLGCLFIIYLFYNIVGQDVYGNKYFTSGYDTPRYELWEAYINSLDMYDVMFGADISKIQLIHLYNDNPHNSYISLHSRTGIFFFSFIFLLVISIKNYLLKKSYYLLSLLLILLLRIYFDIEYLINANDYILYYLILYPVITDSSNRY
jgi:hypothetical protein